MGGMAVAFAVFLLTLLLVVVQPRGLGIGVGALVGAGLALVLGVVRLEDVPVVWGFVWDATFAFVFVILISLVLDEAGFFRWAALHVGRIGGGKGAWLFVLVVLLGAAVAAMFANDGAALILTPIVMEMLLALGFTPAASLAFVMATGFIADTASLPFVVSNLVNIVSADYFEISFDAYARTMLPVNAVAVLASLAVLWWFYRKEVPQRYDTGKLPTPVSGVRDPVVFNLGFVVLVVLLAGYFYSGPLGVPVSLVAGAGAAILLGVASLRRLSVGRLLRGAPWQVVLFSLGMYLVVYGLRNQGLTAYLAGLLEGWSSGPLEAALGTGILSALMSATMNNMPTVMVVALSIDHASVTGAVREAMIYGNVIGSDLGPKFTPIGSLATLLWLHVLERKGFKVGWGRYFKTGVVLTTPVLLVTLIFLGFWLPHRG
ncbi:arsenical pump membrane protein [Oceanithermus desulfurans NBRC 100063]|uniref:Arsenical pump membrane protein n=2 Tax=Oceanithermus desulfurans TaxID=227924 RepID=A0A511RJH9_9DEIN|nr:arsenical pump membrane protein [Oceanithermus desulfurans NBRC 100063]